MTEHYVYNYDELYVYNYDIYMNYIYILVIYIFLLIYLQGFYGFVFEKIRLVLFVLNGKKYWYVTGKRAFPKRHRG